MLTSPQTRHVARAQKHVSVFISHCEQDNDVAKDYESLFNRAGFTTFQFGHGLHFGEHVKNTILQEINKCQFFIFIISDYSSKSDWVQRELGLAVSLQERHKTKKPIIIPIFAENATWRRANKRPLEFPMRDFETGKKCKSFDLSVRCFDKYSNPRSDSDDELISMMKPSVIVSRLDFEDESALHDSEVFALYEQLFPAVERDDPEDIIRWVLHSDVGKERTVFLPEKISYRLDSRYLVLMLAGKAIGLGFFTYDYTTKLLYGNYIAVHECWRSGAIADVFVSEAICILEKLFPEYEGVVFEVEKYDPEAISRIIDYLEESGKFKSEDDQNEVRRFLRVCWYQKINCNFFLSYDSNEPISYTAPCLDPREDCADWKNLEETYWLMWLPREGLSVGDSKLLLERTIRCVYLEILGKSLVECYPQRALEYWDYVNANISQMIENIRNKDIIFGTYHKRGDLFRRWVKLGIKIAI